MHRRAIHIVTNMRGLDQSILPDTPLCFSYVDSGSESDGTIRFITECLRSDLVILDVDTKKLMIACVLKLLLPVARFRIISVDLILRPPKSFAGRVKAFCKSLLFKSVHRFILYFRDLRGYQRFYGIRPERTIYVPFKVNGWEELQHRPAPTAEGEYVLCAGRTLRDIRTFIEAVREVGCPGVLLQQNSKLLSEHGTETWTAALPPNLSLIVDEGNESQTFIEYISQARVVVIPRFRNDIAATGIGTYLLAMALNRCVIISEGPGASELLTDQAVVVPPEDPAALAQQINSLWNDANLRRAIISKGRDYAEAVAGEERLERDILRASIQSLGDRKFEGERATTSLLDAAQLRK